MNRFRRKRRGKKKKKFPHGKFPFQIAKKERHTEEQARAIFVQLLQAILYLHSNNVVHRDLKVEMIVISDFFF